MCVYVYTRISYMHFEDAYDARYCMYMDRCMCTHQYN